MVIIDIRYKIIHQIIYTVGIIIYLLEVFKIIIVLWVVVGILKILQYLNNKVKNKNQTRKLDSIYLNAYKISQIIAFYPP